ncbi:TA system antitoxin ParD family protein [Zobellella iuensis]|uniref:ParD-like antitoxin of type II toxin-antitoxin system n=1 Tax=Zobellella iuensis TaxID=2803811 RepID=A0ABS1QQV6_9GAMM|nr:hypothetical protein [Zobellella iuensis]MBL1376634.1 hypothetical protein [Zobellella iuensis]
MSQSVRFGDAFLSNVKAHAATENRTVSEQIRHWVAIGRTTEDNPDLPFSFIKDAIAASQELKTGKVKRYVRRTPKSPRAG